MSRFSNIDKALEKLADRFKAKLTKDRPDYPKALRTFEERRIDWIKNDINKAIIIQPTFKAKGVDSSRWNFINIAWYDDAKSANRPQWFKYLAKEVEFKEIEKDIDALISISISNLDNISMDDLK